MSRRLIDGQLPKPVPGSKSGKVGRPKKIDKNRNQKSNKYNSQKTPVVVIQSELDEDLVTKICSVVRIGVPLSTACAYLKIPYRTMRSWITKGYDEERSIYGALLQRILQAAAESEIKDAATLEAFASGRAAEYEREILTDENGNVVYDNNNQPVTKVALDGKGEPIIKKEEIKPNPSIALARLERRHHRNWGLKDPQPAEIDNMIREDRINQAKEGLHKLDATQLSDEALAELMKAKNQNRQVVTVKTVKADHGAEDNCSE